MRNDQVAEPLRDICNAVSNKVREEDVLERFERIAAEFYRDTGYLAPGKDQPAAMCGTPTLEERTAAFKAWLRRRNGAEQEARDE